MQDGVKPGLAGVLQLHGLRSSHLPLGHINREAAVSTGPVGTQI